MARDRTRYHAGGSGKMVGALEALRSWMGMVLKALHVGVWTHLHGVLSWRKDSEFGGC